MASKICAIILAAGESVRMGEPKLLLPFGKKSIIEMVVENVLLSNVNFILVVLGSYSHEVKTVLAGYPVSYCFNDNYKNGMLSSVRCGFRNLPEEFEAVLVFQGDQPFITPVVTNKVIKAYRQTGKGLVVPVYNKKRGHPLLIDSRYREIIGRIPEDVGLRWLVARFPDDVQEVVTSVQGILKDIDTRKDYLTELDKQK